MQYPYANKYTFNITTILVTAGIPVRKPLTDFLIENNIPYTLSSGGYFDIRVEKAYDQKRVMDFLNQIGLEEQK